MSYILKLKKSCVTKLRNDWERVEEAMRLINEVNPDLYLSSHQVSHLEYVLNQLLQYIRLDLETVETELLNDIKNKEISV